MADNTTKKSMFCNIRFGYSGKVTTRKDGFCFGIALIYRMMSTRATAKKGISYVHQSHQVLNMKHFASINPNWMTLTEEQEEACQGKEFLRAAAIIKNQNNKSLIDFVRILNVTEDLEDSSRATTINILEALRVAASVNDVGNFQSIIEEVVVPMLTAHSIAELSVASIKISNKDRTVLKFINRINKEAGLDGAHDHTGFDERMVECLAVIDRQMHKGDSVVETVKASAMDRLRALTMNNSFVVATQKAKDSNEIDLD